MKNTNLVEKDVLVRKTFFWMVIYVIQKQQFSYSWRSKSSQVWWDFKKDTWNIIGTGNIIFYVSRKAYTSSLKIYGAVYIDVRNKFVLNYGDIKHMWDLSFWWIEEKKYWSKWL